jgi:competence protein ComEC
LRETLSSTISAQILVLPLILNKMGTLSLVALPTNILVLGVIPMTMFFGFITGILGFVWLNIFSPFAWISWLLLFYIIKISEIFASLPFASLNINWFSNILMVVCYIIIFSWILIKNKKQNV